MNLNCLQPFPVCCISLCSLYRFFDCEIENRVNHTNKRINFVFMTLFQTILLLIMHQMNYYWDSKTIDFLIEWNRTYREKKTNLYLQWSWTMDYSVHNSTFVVFGFSFITIVSQCIFLSSSIFLPFVRCSSWCKVVNIVIETKEKEIALRPILSVKGKWKILNCFDRQWIWTGWSMIEITWTIANLFSIEEIL